MMGGSIPNENSRRDSGNRMVGASDGQPTLSMSKEQFVGATGTSFKLPNITRGSQSTSQAPFMVDANQSNRQLNDGAATTHHLNVTLGEDKFYYTANENGQRLPNITQSGDSKNDYVGLYSSKKAKDRGSMDFNVQNSFTVGGPAFSPNDHRKDMMMTIDPSNEAGKKVASSRGHQRGNSHGIPPKGRNNQIQTLQTNTYEQGTPQSNSIIKGQGHSGTFENYIGRVITSVQHRKKNPRLKSLFLQGSHQGSMEKYNTIEPHGDYGSVNHQLNDSQLISQSIIQQNLHLNVTNQTLSDEGSHMTKGTKPIAASSFQKTAAQSIIAKSQTTQVSLLGNRDVEQKEPKATE